MNLYKDKPLSNTLQELLMECHEIELMKLEPLEAGGTKNIKSLLMRKLVEARNYQNVNGKTYLAVFITRKGVKYLGEL